MLKDPANIQMHIAHTLTTKTSGISRFSPLFDRIFPWNALNQKKLAIKHRNYGNSFKHWHC